MASTTVVHDSQSTSASNANGVSGIPVPSPGSTEGDGTQNAAWARAQEALKKVNPAAAGYSSMSAESVQAATMQYYPWMAQYGFGASVPPPRTPSAPFLPPGYYTYAPNPFFGMPMPNSTTAPRYISPAARPMRPSRPQAATSGNATNVMPRPSGVVQSPAIRAAPQRIVRPATQHPIRFSIGRPNQSFTSTTSTLPKNSNVNAVQRPNIPDNIRRYIERAYAAVETKEERDKLEDYLRQKLNPLLTSGAAKNVDWDKEPLPSDVNFELKAEWTPASQLRRVVTSGLNAANAANWKSGERDHSNTKHREQSSRSPRRKGRKRRVPSPTIPLYSSSEHSSSDDELHVAKPQRKETNSQKKKKKKQQKGAEKAKWVADEGSNARREERARRFARDDETQRRAHQSLARRRIEIVRDAASTVDEVVVGTCTDIEKSFFRLTSAPDPSTVRPLRILEKALKQVQQKYAANGDYVYANDQLKSIRQDLMIQCIRTGFTVKVYETNARIAIERSDREEYNQCQSQLKLLYTEVPNCANRYEFTAYRLLYYISVANTIDQTTLLSELDAAARRDECIAFALRVREAWALGNFVRLFRLYEKAPRMTSYVMDLFIERERKAALNACLKSYRPSIPVSVLSAKIGLSEQKAVEWLATFGISVSIGANIDCRLHCNAVG
uniref:Leukocyte receptor cluster member 8 n=1 Tax=Ascaris suum TaxID=6253 RepID=F1KY22_ASCSU